MDRTLAYTRLFVLAQVRGLQEPVVVDAAVVRQVEGDILAARLQAVVARANQLIRQSQQRLLTRQAVDAIAEQVYTNEVEQAREAWGRVALAGDAGSVLAVLAAAGGTMDGERLVAVVRELPQGRYLSGEDGEGLAVLAEYDALRERLAAQVARLVRLQQQQQRLTLLEGEMALLARTDAAREVDQLRGMVDQLLAAVQRPGWEERLAEVADADLSGLELEHLADATHA